MADFLVKMRGQELLFSYDGWGGSRFERREEIKFDAPQEALALLGVIEYLRDWGSEKYQTIQGKARSREPRKGELVDTTVRFPSLPLIEVSHPETSFSLTVQLPLGDWGGRATVHLYWPDSTSVKRARIEVGRSQLTLTSLERKGRLDENGAEMLKDELFAFLNRRDLKIKLKKKSDFSREWETIGGLSGIKAIAFRQRPLLELASPRASIFVKDLRGWSRDLEKRMGIGVGVREQRGGIRLSVGGQTLRGRIIEMADGEQSMAIDDEEGREKAVISKEGRKLKKILCRLRTRELVFKLDEGKVILKVDFPGVSLEASPLQKHLQIILADDSRKREFQVLWSEEGLAVWSRSGTEGDFQERRYDSFESGHQENFGDHLIGLKGEKGLIIFRCWPSKEPGQGFDLRFPREIFDQPGALLRLVFLDFETIRGMMEEVYVAAPRPSLW